jgi:hypothetical protein
VEWFYLAQDKEQWGDFSVLVDKPSGTIKAEHFRNLAHWFRQEQGCL